MTTLGFLEFPNIDPVALRLGPIAIRWYGLAYLAGFVSAYALLQRMVKRGSLYISSKQLSDLIGVLALGVIIGGRLGWWLFYHRPTRAIEPWYEPIAIWHGGMSFHGGLMGVALVLLIWSRKNGVPFWNLADCMALVTPIGLFFGRVANFINAELVGRATDVPWGVIFPRDSIPRHPSQLYEAFLEGPTLLISLWLIRRFASPKKGQIAAAFIVLYGVFRFLVEFTRQPDEQLGFIAFGWLTMGQLLSAFIVWVGVVLWGYRQRSQQPEIGST